MAAPDYLYVEWSDGAVRAVPLHKGNVMAIDECDCPFRDGACAYHFPFCASRRPPAKESALPAIPVEGQEQAPAVAREARAYAIEHAGYLATAAETLLASINRLHVHCRHDYPEPDRTNFSEAWRALQQRVYEFRKRADRTLSAPAVAREAGMTDEDVAAVVKACDDVFAAPPAEQAPDVVKELADALAGMVGLIQLIASRDDLPPGLDDVMRLSHRVSTANALLARLQEATAKGASNGE